VPDDKQELTTEDMAGRGSASARDHAPDSPQDAPEGGGAAATDRDVAARDAPATPPASERHVDQRGEVDRQPQAGSQSAETAAVERRED